MTKRVRPTPVPRPGRLPAAEEMTELRQVIAAATERLKAHRLAESARSTDALVHLLEAWLADLEKRVSARDGAEKTDRQQEQHDP